MNFSSDSVKLKSKAQNEDFCFDIETPRGHFFAVLDFAPHDYANLNATLKGKVETIVGSFVSLSRFSADLFLGFLAKEINNFLHNLGEQSGGPELLCSAALCLVSGNRLSHFLCGDVTANVISNGRILPLNGQKSEISTPDEKAAGAKRADEKVEQLGAENQVVPLTDRVQAFTLRDDDVVLVMTRGVEEAIEWPKLTEEILSLQSSDSRIICEALMKASAASRDDRTLVVITGPYERYVDPVLADLSKAVSSLEAKMNALAETDDKRDVSGAGLETARKSDRQLEHRFSQQIDVMRDDLKGKAARIDLLELDEKLKNLSDVLAGKADRAEVLGLQRDVLKLGMVSHAVDSSATGQLADVDTAAKTKLGKEDTAAAEPVVRQTRWLGLDPLIAALLALAIAIAGGFIGAWVQSKVAKKSREVWSVKTSANQILITRRDGTGEQGTVNLNVAQPLNSTGEQTFSSFADVKRYIDTITEPPSDATNQPPAAKENQSPESVTEITVKPGDSLKGLAQTYNVPPEKLMELNPTITRWASIRIGQKIVVPAPASTNTPSPAADQSSAGSPAGNATTTEVTIGSGDSLENLARRYKTTADRLKELNPQITNWVALQAGQKILVPIPPRG